MDEFRYLIGAIHTTMHYLHGMYRELKLLLKIFLGNNGAVIVFTATSLDKAEGKAVLHVFNKYLICFRINYQSKCVS